MTPDGFINAHAGAISDAAWHQYTRRPVLSLSGMSWEDWLQGCLLGVWLVAGRHDPDRGSPPTFIWAAVMRLAVNAVEDARRFKRAGWLGRMALRRGDTLAVLMPPDAGLIAEEEARANAAEARKRLRRLKCPRQREIVTRCIMGGKMQKDVAEALGVSKERVRQILARAVAEMRGEVAAWMADDKVRKGPSRRAYDLRRKGRRGKAVVT